jgi:hypothetical protein
LAVKCTQPLLHLFIYLRVGLAPWDRRVQIGAGTTFYLVGTAAIESVIDRLLKVYSVLNLQVIDTSVVSLELER